MEIFEIIEALILALTALFLIHLFRIYTYLNEFPTPSFTPIIGHVFDYSNPSTLETITKNVIKCGGIMRQYLGPQHPFLVVADKDFLEFTCKNNRYISKGSHYNYIKPWLGEGLVTSNGEKWKQRRRALSTKFSQTSLLQNFLDIFNQKSDILLSVLDKYHNKDVNLQPIMKRFTFDIICETAMGICLNQQSQTTNTEYAASVETLCDIYYNRMSSYLMRYDFFYQRSDEIVREKKALAVIDDILEKILNLKSEVKKSSGENDATTNDFLDLLLNVEIDGKRLNKDDIREEVNTFILAGYDTSSTALSLILYKIAEHPDIQKKLLEEQKEVLKEDFKKLHVSFENLHKMPYLDMVIKETLRMHAIIPMSGRRLEKDGLKYDNINLPSTVNFSIFMHGFHHNPEYFPEPEKFRPERFSSNEKIDKFTYMPFGVKPRQCLGKNFAMLELKSAISKILRTYQLINISEHQLDLKPKLLLYSATGICIKIRKRSKNITKKQEASVNLSTSY
ncbi:cytochrome P450 4d1-like isoform X2 [Sitophilus oryzae]|uniref:Cytochrome P450 4d1-like isoform X2 n=1 Tax=Sitophilus oryzae TaxID=7048 RepID=A0A6J2YUT3_SITOR|nr:cytochrome P450 4d1-like isoform X2 [Sitophilus oryzae]